MNRLRGILPIMLLASLGSHPEMHTPPAADDWWSKFVAEMKAIGCINIRQNEQGEWDFDCPEQSIEAAKRIVARYRARYA
jgi:hypothetical protein